MRKILILITSILIFCNTYAQNLPQDKQELSLQKAVEIALVNNYDIKVAKNDRQKAKNNNTAGNAGLLPSISLNGGVDYSNSNTEMLYANTTDVTSVDGAEAFSYNASARLDYVLFDGFGNVYTYRKLRHADARQETLFRQQSESTVILVIKAYYDVCRSQENLNLAKESMRISRERYNRVIDQKYFGKANQLDILNAEVDLNNDSTLVLNTEQAYLRTIRDLNVVLAVPIQDTYAVNDSITFRNDLIFEQIISDVLTNNTKIIAQRQLEEISNLDLKITKAKRYPKVTAYGQYAYSRQDNDAGQLSYNQSYGPSAGVSLFFNVFNGRQQIIHERNSQLDLESQIERSAQLASSIERDASNAYTDYIYKRKIVDLHQSNLKQAELNFDKTVEMFKIGRVSSIEFRTAQQNLLSVAANYNDAKFNAKVAEFYLLQLTGKLLLSDTIDD